MDAELKLVALKRLHDGTLPPLQGCRTFGGSGSGGNCALCGQAIPRRQMEIELDYLTNVGTSKLVLHVECYYAWVGALRDVEVAE